MQIDLTVTEPAWNKILDVIVDSGDPGVKLRAFVQGGGCSGFQYGFTLDETVNDDDFVIDGPNNVQILVDSVSYQYLAGATLDYKNDVMGSSFIVSNPNAKASCGCGSSFTV
jgi:iron-sulfur cluster insertion protein